MLVQAAAQQWNVKPTDCRVEKGVVTHPVSSQRATYGSLADAASKLPVPSEIPLKSAAQFTQIGKPTRRLDTPSKTDGSAQFGLDVRLLGMLTAVVERPPVFGAKVMRFDAAEAEKVPGVKVVAQVPSGVAVIAKGFWPAKVGREKLKVTWDEGENAKLSTEQMLADFAALSASPGTIARKTGDPAAALASAAKTIRAQYDVPYLAHAMMEPLNCVVDLKGDHCEIWTGTQFQTVDRANAAKAAGVTPDKVQIHTTLVGWRIWKACEPCFRFRRRSRACS